MRHIQLEGTAEAMGRQHGEMLRDLIVDLAKERIEVIRDEIRTATNDDVELVSREIADEIKKQVPEIYAESTNVALAAGIDYWRLIVAGGYSDVEDRVAVRCGARSAVSECTLLPARSESGAALLAGTWDSHASAGEALVLVRREPSNGPATLALSTAGWPMQQGVTSNGLAFAIANLVGRRSQPGISYIAALPEITIASTAAAAADRAGRLILCSARFFAICDRHGDYVGIETDGREYWLSELPDVHTNHFVFPDTHYVEGRDSDASERRRQAAVRRLANSGKASAALFEVMAFFDGSDASISRRGELRETVSCAAFVLDPSRKCVSVVSGPPGLGEPVEYTLD
jgi:hypothetical protein